jgi:hypothetical protein
MKMGVNVIWLSIIPQIPLKTQCDWTYQLFKRLTEGRLTKGGQRDWVTNYPQNPLKNTM